MATAVSNNLMLNRFPILPIHSFKIGIHSNPTLKRITGSLFRVWKAGRHLMPVKLEDRRMPLLSHQSKCLGKLTRQSLAYLLQEEILFKSYSTK